MAKEFKDWVDEFVENGANPADVAAWSENGGGGEGTDLDSITYFLWQKCNTISWTERPFDKKLLLTPKLKQLMMTTSLCNMAAFMALLRSMFRRKSTTPNYINVKDITNGEGTTVTLGCGPNTAAYSCDIKLTASGGEYPYTISATVTRVGQIFASSGLRKRKDFKVACERSKMM